MGTYTALAPRMTPWFKLLETNQTDVNGTNLVDALTETRPTNMIPMRDRNGHRYRGIAIKPFGTDAANETFNLILQAVDIVTDYGLQGGGLETDHVFGLDNQYFIRGLTTLACVLHTTTGTAGAYVTNTDLFPDAFPSTLTTHGTLMGTITGQAEQITNADGGVYYFPDVGPSDYVRITFDLDAGAGGDAASANCLVKLFTLWGGDGT